MKKAILSLLVAAIAISADAQVIRKGVVVTSNRTAGKAEPKYNLGEMQGKWLETGRNVGAKSYNYSDTIQLEVNGKNYTLKTTEDMFMTMKGEAVVEFPDKLTLVSNGYRIKSLSPRKMVLTEDGTDHHFTKVPYFTSELYGRDSVKTEKLYPQKLILQRELAGEWEVYKRTGPPGITNSTTVLVRKMTLPVFVNGRGKGTAVLYDESNMATTFEVEYRINGSELTLKTSISEYTFTIYKVTDKLLTFGRDGDIVNYAKKL